ncbi:hypothetical protein AGLY_010464 [Aphis glycines]|uniref:Reverse transcriptase domain-containing protein n=1 Tax=Aphis glycines TaxID=307491 RepID=A0A6G0TE13_APHGL|nr:hypothetical protein AGLY_010464 [Aphis glycines]
MIRGVMKGKGLRQGDALSPTLFNLGLEKVIRESYEERIMEVIGEETVLAYADDIVLLGNTREEVTRSVSKLIKASKIMGLCINEEKIKLMILSRRNLDQSNLKVGSMNFEKVDNFKYLGVNINSSNNMQREIKEKISNGNRCYFSINKLLRSKLLSRKSKTTLYTSNFRPIVTYGCETWSTTKDDNRKLVLWERKILKNICIWTSVQRQPRNFWKKTRPRTRWKDTLEKEMRLIDEHVTLDWTLDREKWKGLLVAA